jgi:hypothetical protein
MPHVTLHALDEDLAGREPSLIKHLTNAVVSVYGEWARRSVMSGSSAYLPDDGPAAEQWSHPPHRQSPFACARKCSHESTQPASCGARFRFPEAVTAVFGDDCRDEVLVTGRTTHVAVRARRKGHRRRQ